MIIRQWEYEQHQPLPPDDLVTLRRCLERIAACRLMATAIAAGILETVAPTTEDIMTESQAMTAQVLMDAALFFNAILKRNRKIYRANVKNRFAIGHLLRDHFPGMSAASSNALGDRIIALRERARALQEQNSVAIPSALGSESAQNA
jgi:hypothetical protein